jgi:hypothetical protein
MAIQDFTREELEAELARREAEEKTKPPPILAQPNFEQLKEAVVEHVEAIARMGTVNRAGIQTVYEIAIETVYGKDVLCWIENRTK